MQTSELENAAAARKGHDDGTEGRGKDRLELTG